MAYMDSVQGWLSEIRLMTETECMSVLQGKSLSQDLQQSSTTLIKCGIDAIRNQSHVISNEFSKLFKCVEGEKWRHLQPLTVQVTCHIRSLIQECNKCLHHTPNFILEQQEIVMGECAKLAQQVETCMSTKPQMSAVKIPLVNQLTFLGQSFSRLVDMALGYLVQKIVETLDESHTPLALTSCISTVISLGLEGEHMCYILSREGCIRALFEIARTDTLEFAHVQSLRALATICCVAESILELEKEGGIDSLTDILCDKTISEAVRGEAAGVVAQITSPCLDNFQHISGFLENVQDLLSALINLCYTTASHETFLLAAAAIANITFMDSQACDVLQQLDAPRLLIQASATPKAKSLFVKDQIATVLANMATTGSSRRDIIAYNGIPLLINFLQQRPSQYKQEAEISACERLQQKAAIALTRLCKDEVTANVIVDLQGVPRLVQLCRSVEERNNSDAVLVASLAALRKICALCPCPEMTTVDYHQLIKPRLMDSFLMCSRTDENFV
ncbi:protein inscuteable homolog [Mercenaria mercenaria]|uniref:protein inscuteable homolog n=1 Tax=Mercenaria mercenaria TaxID=6596 RepID=UPI001E1D22FD|nr:protein inscuteable homolog [Mercenaria mercenaria]